MSSDATATIADLVEHEGLARFGIAADLAVVLTQAMAALWFFKLFRRLDASAAGAIAAFGLVNAVVSWLAEQPEPLRDRLDVVLMPLAGYDVAPILEALTDARLSVPEPHLTTLATRVSALPRGADRILPYASAQYGMLNTD